MNENGKPKSDGLLWWLIVVTAITGFDILLLIPHTQSAVEEYYKYQSYSSMMCFAVDFSIPVLLLLAWGCKWMGLKTATYLFTYGLVLLSILIIGFSILLFFAY